MSSRMKSYAPVLAIIAVSFILSYLFYTTGSFAVSANHSSRIEASGWRYYQVWAIENDTMSGSLEVTTEGVIDFYFMTENNYRYWTGSGGSTGSLYQRTAVEMLEWNVSIPIDGIYFVIYSNRGNSASEQIQASMHVETSRSLLWPVIATGTILAAAFLICMTTIRRVKDTLTL